MKVEVEDDAVPIVRVIGAMVRRSLTSAATTKHARRAGGGVAVLQSATDPQAVTLRFTADTIRLERGSAADAGVTIVADLADEKVKPKVTGAARHPLLALAVAKLLEPPIGTWNDEADCFLSRALRHDACPRPIRLRATDEGRSRQWGGEGEPAIELHGTADALAKAMSGSSLFIEDVLSSTLCVVGDMGDLSVLTGFGIDHMFGEL